MATTADDTAEILHQARVVFCESTKVLEWARGKGLPETATVLTTAPAVALSGQPGVRALEPGVDRLMAYWHDAGALTRDMFAAARANGLDHDRALLAAREAQAAYRKLTKLLALTEADFVEPRVNLGLRTGSAALDERLNGPWQTLLAGNPHLRTVWCDLPRTMRKMPPPPLVERLRMSGIADIGCQLARRWWQGRPAGNRPTLVLAHTNEFVREAAWAMIRRGVAVRLADAPTKKGAPAAVDDAVAPELTAIFRSYAARWFPAPAVDMAVAAFHRNLAAARQRFEQELENWKASLSALVPNGKGAVLTNFPGTPSLMALCVAARGLGLPVAAFQHGVTREICGTHDVTACYFENGVADVLFTMNEAAAQASRQTPYARGRAEAVGMPKVYSRMAGGGRTDAGHPLLYVSTALLSGNVNAYSGGVSDVERVRRELALVEQVLARVPYGVRYKSYPSTDRYDDPDPVLAQVVSKPNLQLFDRPLDLRYMISRHRLVITSRATSTVGWCLKSGKPLVFINHPDHMPLRDDAHELYAQGVFLFDWRNDATLEQLRAFLSRPLDEIEAEWQDKAGARRALEDKLLCAPGAHAGERVADLLMPMMERRD